MKARLKPLASSQSRQDVPPGGVSELLLLPDGRILVHNLTPEFARLLNELNPDDPQILPRAGNETTDEHR